MIDVVILDLDGVVRHWDPDHFRSTVESFGLTREQFAAVAFDDELLHSAMTGAAVGGGVGRRDRAPHR